MGQLVKDPKNLNDSNHLMLIGGLQKFSVLDYPGYLSAIVFTQGCNFRCQFCYNPMLVWPLSPSVANAMAGKVGKLKYAQATGRQKDHPQIKEDDFFVFLRSRVGKLDAIVITGGEPCLQKDLFKFISKIKKLGFLVKLDTNGSYPETLAKLIKEKLIDYIAMDLKAPGEKYEEAIGTLVSFNKIKQSVKIIMQSGLPYEFRTTVVPGLLNQEDIREMGKIIKGARKWYLQKFKSDIDLVERSLEKRVPYNSRQMQELAEIGKKYIKICEVR